MRKEGADKKNLNDEQKRKENEQGEKMNV